ncbi:MAG: hypothetical protein ACKOTF_04790, partial [Opitutaceae bacterium]
MRRAFRLLAAILLAAPGFGATPPPAPAPWRSGVAARKITPSGPIWLAGYANRTAASDGVDTDLFAKA